MGQLEGQSSQPLIPMDGTCRVEWLFRATDCKVFWMKFGPDFKALARSDYLTTWPMVQRAGVLEMKATG